MANYIMMMGTSSHVGKSILATAMCRILYRRGRKVVPFKAQNMALNSYVTRDGDEMGRAQVAQAEAAGMEPMVDMNPVLLKPTGNACSQVIIMGKPVGNMSAREYHKGYSLKAFGAVKEALARLDKEYDTIVIEGAGSPAEINLKANDIVNMRVAKYLNAPVLLIADIDRGGALASLVGTLELLDQEERALVKGLVINKFRGDVTLLTPAIDFLEEKTGKPVLGVVPHIEQMGIDDEDSVSLQEKQLAATEGDVKIAVIQTPKISNFTDFDALAYEKDVSLYYVQDVDGLGEPDIIMLPGSKNTSQDMAYLEKSGLAEVIRKYAAAGKAVIGICGGYQMLGELISDPEHTESEMDSIQGLGLLGMKTVFAKEKLTSQVEADCHGLHFLGQEISAQDLKGYEIHMGHTEFTRETDEHPFAITCRGRQACQSIEGTAAAAGNIFGTYIHGVFDNDEFRRSVLNAVRESKGLEPLANTRNVMAEKQQAYEHLADVVEEALDMDKLYEIMGEKNMLTAVLAFLVDTVIGDPRSKYHPVVLIGRLISILEGVLYHEGDSDRQKLLSGGLLTVTVLLVVYTVVASIKDLLGLMHNDYIVMLLEGVLLSFTISPRSLAEAGREIYGYLAKKDMENARYKVGWIVGRDTEKLSEGEVTRATVETVAENTVDGIIAPYFFFLIGGVPLAYVYRAANTLDSMVGYKNDKYLYFGRVSARLDDVLNYIPARITGLIFVLSAMLLKLDWQGSWRMLRRDAAKHPSPNGGWAEASVAGALRIRLGGWNSYFGRESFRAYMGEPLEELAGRHILGCIRMMYTATVLFLLLSHVVMLILK